MECGQWRGREQKRGSRGGTWKYCPTGMARRRAEAGCGASRLNKKNTQTPAPPLRSRRLAPLKSQSSSLGWYPSTTTAASSAVSSRSAGSLFRPRPRPRSCPPPSSLRPQARSRAVRPRQGRRIVPAAASVPRKQDKCGRFRATNRLDSGFVTSSFFIHYVILLRYTRLTTVSSH